MDEGQIWVWSTIQTRKMEVTAGLNLDLLCVQQLEAAPFCENYAKLYFDTKHLEKGLNGRCWNVWSPFIKKVPLGQYQMLPWFFRLVPQQGRFQAIIKIKPKRLGECFDK